MIRLATPEDLYRLVEMAEEAMTTVRRYQGKLVPNREAIAKYMADLIASPIAFFVVLERDGAPYGMLACSKGVHPLTASLGVSGHFWWVTPGFRGAGLQLLKAMLIWGESEGAQFYTIGGSSRAVRRVYQRFGFEKLEDIYMKRAT